jgi:uncharacterized membrane protein YdbT with pleckstrin-like domain
VALDIGRDWVGYYVSQQLRKDEKVIYEANVHWVVYILPLAILYFSVPAMLAPKTFDMDVIPTVGTVATLGGMVLLINAVIRHLGTELAMTNERVIAKFGLISRSTFEQQLDRVEGVNLDQSILGRLLNYGTVTVRGVGGSYTPLPLIKKPRLFQKTLSEVLSDVDD